MRHSTIIKRMVPAFLLMALIHVSLPAAAAEALLTEEAPSRGTGLIVWGSVLTAVGAIGLGGAAAFFFSPPEDLVDSIGRAVAKGPFVLMAIGSGVLVSVGLPLLITGSIKRSRYNEWRDRHPATATALEGLSVSAGPRGGQLGWRYTF